MIQATRRNGTVLLVWLVGLGLTWSMVCGGTLREGKRIEWKHLSSKKGDLPAPGPSTQQTASLVLDIDKDGVSDFVVGARKEAPCMLWFRRGAKGWTRYLIDGDLLPIEAGGTFTDIDADGDLDIVMGEDGSGNKVYWWENPFPGYKPGVPWTRRLIKGSGGNKHHDQLFGDFDGDGRQELAFWNQGGRRLFLAEIPADPKTTQPWPIIAIYSWSSGPEHEGLASADIDSDGKVDIIGAGRWFKHVRGTEYEVHVIDADRKFTRSAAGQLKKGGAPEVVIVPGDADGPIKWYEWNGRSWVGHDLLGSPVIHGHSLAVGDVDGDTNLDIFCAEMHTPGHGDEATMWVFYGDGKGNFAPTVIARGIGNHESRLGDLDGDGDPDILCKPYTWSTPRVDVWLNVLR